jgi:predicted nucleic acid-binding protein
VSKVLVLDSGPLGILAHPDLRRPDVLELQAWVRAHESAGSTLYLPEIIDYELRPELERVRKRRSLRRLDQLANELDYLPIDTPTVRRAAVLWGQARRAGHVTASPEALDADVILAAQAESVEATIVTAGVSSRSGTGRVAAECRCVRRHRERVELSPRRPPPGTRARTPGRNRPACGLSA